MDVAALVGLLEARREVVADVHICQARERRPLALCERLAAGDLARIEAVRPRGYERELELAGGA